MKSERVEADPKSIGIYELLITSRFCLPKPEWRCKYARQEMRFEFAIQRIPACGQAALEGIVWNEQGEKL